MQTTEILERGKYGRTFRESKNLPVHRWYSYVEGFSADYLVSALDRVGNGVSNCFDPFGGTGTTVIEASRRGLDAYYAEANPLMPFVIDAKVASAGWCAENLDIAKPLLVEYVETLLSSEFATQASNQSLERYESTFPRRDFFETKDLRELLAAVEAAIELGDVFPHVGSLALLACVSNVVNVSNMTRRADLRRRRPNEYPNRVVNVTESIAEMVSVILEDLTTVSIGLGPAEQVANDCRDLDEQWFESFDCAVTSPPYLNGTNYIRNTKLELFILGLIESEKDLAPLRLKSVRGGITQAATSIPVSERFEAVEVVASELDECAGDRRIPHMVRAYFSDMSEVLQATFQGLRPGAPFLLDIGDSKFYGVHVPTDLLLAEVAEDVGFSVAEHNFLAPRYSRDKSPLVQAELVLVKP